MRGATILLAALCLSVTTAFAPPAHAAPWIELQISPEAPAHVQNPGGVLHAQVWIHDASASEHSVAVSITAPDGAEIYRQDQAQIDYIAVDWTAPSGLSDGFYTLAVEYAEGGDATETASKRFLLAGLTSDICSYKFIDLNRNGVYDEGIDTLAAGWEICVTNPPLGCQVTPPDEWVVCWFFLTPGTYTICETQQAGYEPTLPPCQTYEVHTGEIVKVEFGNAIAQGACCFPDGSCTFTTQAECEAAGGIYQGDDSDCDPNPCPQPTGACCFHPGGDCQVLTAAACEAAGGSYLGNGVGCNPGLCPPTAIEKSTWGQLKNTVRR